MKQWSLAFDNIKNLFRKNKLIFMLFFIGMTVCIICFIYFYGNTMSYKVNEAKNLDLLRTYRITFSPAEQTDHHMPAFLDGEPVEDIILQSEIPFQKIQYQEMNSIFKEMYQNGAVPFCASVKNRTTLYAEQGRVTFHPDELENASPVLIVPYLFLSRHSISNQDHPLLIDGTRFRMIGACTLNTFYIPVNTFFKMGLSSTGMKVVFKNILSVQQEQAFYRKINARFPSAKITGPEPFKEFQKENAPTELFMVGIVYVMALISFMFLMKYMIDENRRELVIYSIAGASQRQISRQLILQITLLSVLASIAAIALYVCFYNLLFSKINITENITYNWRDYGIILIFSVLLADLTAYPFLLSCRAKSIVQLKNKCE
ncbi:MAG: ABC transporter permease [Clostridiales bacterium]|nr:ABC transporter permease [Clostridiales bacterium]